jgi:hypothetical protein
LKNRNDIGFVVEYIKGHEPSNRQTRINRKVLRNRIVINQLKLQKVLKYFREQEVLVIGYGGDEIR